MDSREIPMAKFPASYMTPAIESDEMVTGLRLAPWPRGHGSAFAEFSRRHGDFALASVGVLLNLGRDEIRHASITVGGLSHAPVRVTEAESALTAAPPSDALFLRAAAACGAFQATADVHGSAFYRQHLAKTLAHRAISTAYARALASRSGQQT